MPTEPEDKTAKIIGSILRALEISPWDFKRLVKGLHRSDGDKAKAEAIDKLGRHISRQIEEHGMRVENGQFRNAEAQITSSKNIRNGLWGLGASIVLSSVFLVSCHDNTTALPEALPQTPTQNLDTPKPSGNS